MKASAEAPSELAVFRHGHQTLVLADCFEWLAHAGPNSISAVVTDPPYGLIEYQPDQQRKLRAGRGGVWRIPPSFDGANRRPLPRFTILTKTDREGIVIFFERWARLLHPIVRPGAHVAIAGNPLVSPLVASAMERAGFERRGEIVRLVRTFRGGDRPKGAEEEFPEISSMPRACWEPWGLYRKPIETKTLAENLRKWGTGGLRRVSEDTPFLDVIESGTAPDVEREIAPHPSLKPQAFLRKLVRGLLPRGDGIVLDPFAGCASTLAACEALGVEGIGLEIDPTYYELGRTAIPGLSAPLPLRSI
ncbi:MAG: site-specific DNA-methyltransferase [Chloroflexi bacterium]|nr:site-specific DNA-methyltransferase [Chloroflexota bacterium]